MLLSAALSLALSSALAGCADDDTTQNFPPLTYTYLNPLHLNVGHIDIVDQSPPGTTTGDVSALSPESPQQALEEMARDRLIASGTQEGSATFTITHAAILHEPGGTLQGNLDVQISVASQGGARVGLAEAHVSRTYNPGDQAPESRGALYALTSQMMQDMNVEMEYQIKHSLASWLVDASGAPLGGVQQQSLSPDAQSTTTDQNAAPLPAGNTTDAAVTPNVTPDAAPSTPETDAPASSEPASAPKAAAPSLPDAIFPTGAPDATGNAATPPAAPVQEHSPPPNSLKLPDAPSTTGTPGD